MTPEYINAHEPIYSYLLSYFLPDLSDPYFRQDAAHEIEQDERMTYCRYMAAWLPYEPHYEEILNQIAGAAQCANDKEDAIDETDILFSHTHVICRGGAHLYGSAFDFLKRSPGGHSSSGMYSIKSPG